MESDESTNQTGRFRTAYCRVFRALDVVRLRQWEHSNLTMPQLRVLFQVRRSPGVTTGELARLLGITVSTTSGLVAKLVDAGLVVRGQGTEDRRQIPLELTEAGRAEAGELSQLSQPFFEQLVGALGDDLQSVTDALERLAEISDGLGREDPAGDSRRAKEGL
jgi:DNA-binding MarR family transcriptional regulator